MIRTASDWSLSTAVRDAFELAKPEISFLVMISAAGGFVLASPAGSIDWIALMHTVLGTGLAAGGSRVLNHVREMDHDAAMRRTRERPLPAGRISVTAATVYGSVLALAGPLYLAILVNVLTGVLAIATVGCYLLVYTPLKRVTTYNTLIGCIPGAMPALGGWVAATGTIGLGGAIFYTVLFAWQMPHFLALAWMYRNDYERGGFAMLPVHEPSGRSTAGQTLFFTVLMVVFSLLPGVIDLVGWAYLLGATALGVYFLVPALRFFHTRTNRTARRVLTASIVYVPVLVGLILVDRTIL